jgi:cation transporter family protein
MYDFTLLLGVLVCISTAKADYQLNIAEGYNIHERPVEEGGGPLKVEASINVRNILDIDEKAQLVSLETTLRFFWKDTRITPKDEYLESEDSYGMYTSLNPSMANNIWMPDVFIDQAKALRIPTYFVKPANIRVYNDSRIRYSSRINFDVACNMDFHMYPVDEQDCVIKFESYGLQNKQMQMNWQKDGLTVNPDIHLAQFEFRTMLLEEYTTDYYDLQYPGLEIKLHLKRLIAYHVVQTYIPSTVFVILAWLSMFIPPESVPGRVGMGMTTMLTLTAMFSSVRNNVPKVSYISVLDLWMLMSILFVFSCLLEFIIITALIRNGKKLIGQKVERVCQIAIPVLYISFVTLYIVVYSCFF